MTNLNQPDAQLPTGPVLGYWSARAMATDRTKGQKATRKGCDRRTDEVMAKVEAVKKAFGVRKNPDRARRLAGYLAKPNTYAEALMLFQQGRIPVIYSWETQRAYLPREYEEDWNDFQSLRDAAARAEFRDEVMGK